MSDKGYNPIHVEIYEITSKHERECHLGVIAGLEKLLDEKTDPEDHYVIKQIIEKLKERLGQLDNLKVVDL